MEIDDFLTKLEKYQNPINIFEFREAKIKENALAQSTLDSDMNFEERCRWLSFLQKNKGMIL